MEGHQSRLFKDYDSEMSPRRRPPPTHEAPMVNDFEWRMMLIVNHGAFFVQVARQPLVPELSLFFPGSTSTSQVEPHHHVPKPQPPTAKRPPLVTISANRGGHRRPTSPAAGPGGTCCQGSQLDATVAADFTITSDTQMFERLEKQVAARKGGGGVVYHSPPSPPPPAPPMVPSPNVPKEVRDFLEWQNGQIRDLQATLGKLMAASRETTVVDDEKLGSPHSQSASSLPQRLTSPAGLQPSDRLLLITN